MENIKHPTERITSKQLTELSDREIQEKILANLRNIRNSNNSIKGWITFFGILQILVIIAVLVIYNS